MKYLLARVITRFGMARKRGVTKFMKNTDQVTWDFLPSIPVCTPWNTVAFTNVEAVEAIAAMMVKVEICISV
jgi:hypothetical protein